MKHSNPLIKSLLLCFFIFQLVKVHAVSPISNLANAKTTSFFASLNIKAQNNSNPFSEITSFKGTRAGNSILLEWETNSGIDNIYFEIERSSNNKDFEMIGKIDGRAKSAAMENYSFSDEPFNETGNLYYRLKYTDNGISKYTPSIEVKDESNRSELLKVWYSKENESIIVNINENKESEIQIRVTNMYGRIVATKDVTANTGMSSLVISMMDTKSGIYIVTIHDNTSLFSARIGKN